MAKAPFEYCEIVQGLFFINWRITKPDEYEYNASAEFVDLQKLVHNEFGLAYDGSAKYYGDEMKNLYSPLSDEISSLPRIMSEKWICGLFLKLPQLMLAPQTTLAMMPSIEPSVLSEQHVAIAGLHCNCFPDAIEIYNVAAPKIT